MRLEEDVTLCTKWKVPIVITSLGAREDVNAAVHSYGGLTLHDVISNRFARKAVERGPDGLIAVAAGAGGHAGTLSSFALVQEIRTRSEEHTFELQSLMRIPYAVFCLHKKIDHPYHT